MKIRIYALLFFMTALFTNTINAQDGANDPTFNPEDTGFGNGTDSAISAVAAQPDGKIIIVGNFTKYNQLSVGRIARLNANESQDMGFAQGAGANGLIRAVQLSADGKILIAGDFSSYNGITRNRIARLNTDGSLDETFNPGSGANNSVYTITISQDGTIFIGGQFTQYNEMTSQRIVKLNNDGTLNTSFSSNVANTVRQIALQADGKIVIGGDFTYVNGLAKNYIARLNEDGTTDTSFIATGADMSIYSLLVSDDKIYVGGPFFTFNGAQRMGLVRLNQNGSIDTAFGSLNGYVLQMVRQPDGKIIAAGEFGSFNDDYSVKNVIRFSEDGTVDSFIAKGAEGLITSIALKSDGKVLFAGSFYIFNNHPENHITCYNSDGSRDVSFDIGTGTGVDNAIQDSVILPDGKILIAGDFFNYNGVSRNKIAKLNADGTLDFTFNPGTGANGSITNISVLEDGKIMIAGYFTTYNGQTSKNVARLNPDGSLDTSFSTGAGFGTFEIYSLATQNDGKILLGGLFITYDDQALATPILRFNQDGTLDAGFDFSLFVSNTLSGNVKKIIVLEDGKLLVGRNPGSVNGVVGNSIVRINSNGTLDASFTPVSGIVIGNIFDMELRADGKIVVLGSDWVSSPAQIKLLRFESNGLPDTSLEPLSQDIMQYTRFLSVQDDGKMFISGNNVVQGSASLYPLIRLNENGSVDTAFESGPITSGLVTNILLQSENKIIVTGYFNSYNNAGRNRIARIVSNGAMGTNVPDAKSDKVIVYRNGDLLNITSAIEDISEVKVYGVDGKLIATQNGTSDSSVSIEGLSRNAIYIVKVRLSGNKEVTKKIFY